jgi:hypothetical protein
VYPDATGKWFNKIINFNLEDEMNHFSLEVLGRENQRKLLSEQLHEQKVNGYRRTKLSARAKLLAIMIASLIAYFWLFV